MLPLFFSHKWEASRGAFLSQCYTMCRIHKQKINNMLNYGFHCLIEHMARLLDLGVWWPDLTLETYTRCLHFLKGSNEIMKGTNQCHSCYAKSTYSGWLPSFLATWIKKKENRTNFTIGRFLSMKMKCNLLCRIVIATYVSFLQEDTACAVIK